MQLNINLAEFWEASVELNDNKCLEFYDSLAYDQSHSMMVKPKQHSKYLGRLTIDDF